MWKIFVEPELIGFDWWEVRGQEDSKELTGFQPDHWWMMGISTETEDTWEETGLRSKVCRDRFGMFGIPFSPPGPDV